MIERPYPNPERIGFRQQNKNDQLADIDQSEIQGRDFRLLRNKDRVRQRCGFSPLLFNCVLEIVIREWRKEVSNRGFVNGVRLSYSSMNLTVKSLAFADDTPIISDSLYTAARQFNQLRTEAAEEGLQIFFEKTVFVTNIKPVPRELEVRQGKVKRREKFKYLGEWIELIASEKEALTSQINKMEMT